MAVFELPFGEGTMSVDLPDCSVTVAEPAGGEVVEECLLAAGESAEDAVEPCSDVLFVPDALNTLLV
jgi:hypothetical protein